MGRWAAEMIDTDGKPLEEMLAVCKTLGAEVRYSPEGRYFTATVWNGLGAARERTGGACHPENNSMQGRSALRGGVLLL